MVLPSPFSWFQPLTAVVLLLLLQQSHAGTYFQDYTALPSDGTIINSNNSVSGIIGGKLRLTQSGVGNSLTGMRVPDLDPGKEVTEFTVEFDLTLYTGGTPADGFSLTYGNVSTNPADLINGGFYINNGAEEGYGAANNFIVSFDTYDNGNNEAPAIEAKAGGTIIKSIYMGASTSPGGLWNRATNAYPFDNISRHVYVHWEVNTGLDVKITGQSGSLVDVMVDTALPGFVPSVGNVFLMAARTGGATEDVFVDNMSIVTVPSVPIETGGPTISEFMADNGSTREDEDCTSGAWLEIYNGQAATQSFSGWFLTDDPANLSKWAIPGSVSLAGYTYTTIWADSKNRTTAPNYHTNFTLNKAGGYLALVNPALTVVSSYTYAAQANDVSYGKLGVAQTAGYLETPTAGYKNSGLQALLAPSKQDVTFDHVGGLITGPLTLNIAAPTIVGAVARYTADNSVPNGSSPLWPAAGLTVTGSMNVRVRFFQPNSLGGDVSSRTFILLDSTLTNYRGTGQPFKSPLPIIVFDSFGIDIDNAGGSPGLRPLRSAYTLAINKDPANANLASILGPVDVQNRGGVHLRGETSAGFAQRPYGLEVWDNKEQDKAVSLLGWPAESDYVLISNYNDKSVIRNMMPFDLKRQLSGDGSAMKEQYVEVFFKQNGSGPLAYADYRGIYVLTEKIKRDKDRVNIDKLDPCDGVFTNTPAVDDIGVISGGYIFRKDKASPEAAFTTNGGTASGTTYVAQTFQIVEPNEPSTAQQTYLKGYVNRFEAALYGASFADPVNGYAKYLDVQSWIDGHLWVEIFKQIDGYRLSTYMYKDRNGKIKYSPLWDYNLSTGNGSPAGGYAAPLEQPNSWYYTSLGNDANPYHPRLFQDPLFLRAYWDRYWQLRRGMFSNANVIATIDRYIAQLKGAPAGVTTLITNGTGIWPNSVPTLDNPIGRHHARWQRLGVYDWPNATNPTLRVNWETNYDPNSFTVTQDPFAQTSETTFVKIWMLRHFAWMDDQSTSYGGTVRNQKPPNFSLYGGEVNSGYNLVVTEPNTTAGTIYYTVDGSDPAAGTGTVLTTTGGSNGNITLISETGAVTYLVPTIANGGNILTRTTTVGQVGDANQWNGLASPPNYGIWSNGSFGLGYDITAETAPAVDTLYAPYIGTSVYFPMLGSTTAPPNNASIYTRSNFNVTQDQITNLQTLRLSIRYDDSFICYLNGVEVTRRNYTGTNPVYNTQSFVARSDAAAIVLEDIDLTSFKTSLLVGNNVLAFHGINFSNAYTSLNAKDFLLQPKLIIIPVPQPTTGTINLTGTTLVRARSKDASNNWSPLTEGNFIVNAVPATAANIVISEFSYDPAPPTAAETTASGANNANDFEFIEIMNISAGTVDLTNCYFDLGVTFNWNSVGASKQTLGPGQRMVLVENPTAFAQRYATNGANIAGAYVGNLNNSGETLTLRAANGSVIKSFLYSKSEPWPVDADLQLNSSNAITHGGYSLVLNNPLSNPLHSDGRNWRTSVNLGGKPGLADAAALPAVPAGDSDGDGITDLVEYAVGSGVATGNQAKLPTLGYGDYNTGTVVERCLEMQFIRNLNADNVTITPKVSSDLASWQNGSVALTYVSTHNNGDGTATAIYRSTLPVAALPNHMFAKLEVTLLP